MCKSVAKDAARLAEVEHFEWKKLNVMRFVDQSKLGDAPSFAYIYDGPYESLDNVPDG